MGSSLVPSTLSGWSATQNIKFVVGGGIGIGGTAAYTLPANIPANGLLVQSKILVGQTTDDNINKIQVAGSIKTTQYNISSLNIEPESATATGVLGEVRITATAIFVCIATNVWVKSALVTF